MRCNNCKKELKKDFDNLSIALIFIVVGNGALYAFLFENIFASYFTLLPLCFGYFIYVSLNEIDKWKKTKITKRDRMWG